MWDLFAYNIKTREKEFKCSHCGHIIHLAADETLSKYKKCKQCGNKNVKSSWFDFDTKDESDDNLAMYFTLFK